ncbi:MAG: beta galactosidase jelly roll domain-containing protein [Clostridia bacterium]|nr:beta galactosidase jelly roll domain-containing protein [Clostridia bacterium]
MNYVALSLNGSWEMGYSREAYHEKECPDVAYYPIENAVPSYWEDMVDIFCKQPFYGKLKTSEYGIQHYPISNYVPDMTLPNILGNFYYKKTFLCADINKDAELHFEGVQNTVTIWINGTYIGHHEGYSVSFDIKVPDGIIKNGENTIILSVSNYYLQGYDERPVTGLTTRASNRGTGGITGDVELRVYNNPIRDVVIFVSEDLDEVSVKIEGVSKADYSWQVLDGENVLKSGKGKECENFAFSTDGLLFWSPESPKLYTLEVTCEGSTLSRVFGVKKLVPDKSHLKLNNKPYFLRGICEHCYYPETVHPNHDIVFYRNVIKKVKSLGFNFIRFHTYVPEEEYMQAADELGMLVQVEAPNNSSVEHWEEIVKICRRHTCVAIYCWGNENPIYEAEVEHLSKLAKIVHEETDLLFSPMSALPMAEYNFVYPETEATTMEPFPHHEPRMKALGEFSDLYNSYAWGKLSYRSVAQADPELIDKWNVVYNKPRLSHEICINGTYTDLSIKDRYKDTRIGKTEMFSSIEKHLEDKGLLKKAPMYFNNSSQWQRRVRKYCFEATRRCEHMAGFDFLGPIDTHWHTFGYDVGMMNEFYELKPGETVRNVLMYNSESVLLSDVMRKTNYKSGEEHTFGIYTSYYGKEEIDCATLSLYLMADGKVFAKEKIDVKNIKNGKVSKLYDWCVNMPCIEKPLALKLYVTLDSAELFCENEWELYVFPEAKNVETKGLIVSDGMTKDELKKLLNKGENIVIFGTEPFASLPTTFDISIAGRTTGNLATVISDHPIMKDFPHEGFCGWQFNQLMEKGNAVCFENDDVVFNPIIDVASSHKNIMKQSALFEFRALGGKLVVCSFDFKEDDPCADWLKKEILSYAMSNEFLPVDELDETHLDLLLSGKVKEDSTATNFAFNPNDVTRKKKN